MRILIVAATEREIEALRPQLAANVDLLVTTVGMVATAAACARALALSRYDMALNIGVCGSFDPALEPGTVVHVVSDRITELGAEDGDVFLPIEAMRLPGHSVFVNAAPPANPVLLELPAVHGITVNTAHGNDRSIAAVVARFTPQVESMEGAAFMCACATSGVPYAQVRAVSNRVERRNRASWRMADALANLTETTVRILEQA